MYLIFILIISFSTFSKDDLSDSVKWQRLLHYKKNIFNQIESQADGEDFFLHPEGKFNPQLELKETIKRFSETENPTDNHPICKFPLRYKWLNHQLGMPWKADLLNCKTYISFFSKLAAKRASVVFSSYYLTNPNSAFGHTLLRLSRFDDKSETEMLDYGINYAANAKETNPFLYAYKGLFGGFVGQFASIPYYYKVREYSDFEFRDLWSYDLKLTMPEVLEMVDHIWELGHTHFDYYYFHENCSYHLLSVLEVVKPSLNLTDTYQVYTIPADTIRLLKANNLIDEGKKRESTYSRLLRFSNDLSNDQLEVAKEIAMAPELVAAKIARFDNETSAKVLDVSLEAFDYYNVDLILKDETGSREKKSHILKARAINPVISDLSQSKTISTNSSPALSHAPTRLSFSEGYIHDLGKYSRFEYRAALHDLLDPSPGSLKNAQLELGKFSFDLQDENYGTSKILFNELSILNIKNYQEQNFWSSPISWELDVGGKQIDKWACWDCPGGYISGSIGNSLQLSNNKLLFSLLLNSELQLQSQFNNNFRLGLGPKFFMRYYFSDLWGASYSSIYHLNTTELNSPGENQFWWHEFETRYHLSQKASLFMKLKTVEFSKKWLPNGELGLQYFYE